MGITETNVQKRLKKPAKKGKKVIIGAISSLCILTGIYFGGAAYFAKHFYYGSEINGVKVSGKSLEKVNELMATHLNTYTLTLKERGNKTEQIKADEIGLQYKSDGDFKIYKDNQNPYKWIFSFFSTEASKITEEIKYDTQLLMERVDKLACLDSKNIVEPKNAGFKNGDNSFSVVDEVMGNKVDKDVLLKHVSEAVLKNETTIDLEAVNSYINPEYTVNSSKVKETKSLLDKYTSSKITYTFGSSKETLDASTISKWITVNEKYEVKLDEAKARAYVDSLAQKYNTVGKTRSFQTSTGKRIGIGRGDYGWAINRPKETTALIEAIKAGQTAEKEPTYSRTALAYGSNDIGNTYVEIDMAKQHLWFYKNGRLVTEGDVVTGNISKGNGTPTGVYMLKYKDKDATLNGEDYSTPVTYWMPFNGNVGIHDATWRNKFGGEIYKTKGSHGCINSPYQLAKAIFENIKPGTPVICYY